MDFKYFRSNKKGEIFELRQDLCSNKDSVKKEAIKSIIASMNFGKDASLLFTDVLNCIQTKNIELKKLVYLYLINYAKSNPERVILAVNTFRKDAKDSNPLVRALAIRTMGCIWVPDILEYFQDVLAGALHDNDTYVLKTAVICVAKLYKMSPKLVKEGCFISELNALLHSNNSVVVANALSVLTEVHELYLKKPFLVSNSLVSKLLVDLEHSSEWAQVVIINVLINYVPSNSAEAMTISNRLIPHLQYSNYAIILAAVRILIYIVDFIDDESVILEIYKKITYSLLTMLLNPPEVQFLILRNISIIIQRFPSVLAGNIKPFFCKSGDPTYLKIEKLNIILKLVETETLPQVLLEIKEYAYEIDVAFSRCAISALGECAIKFEASADNCFQLLLDILKTKNSYAVQEFFIAAAKIFSKYFDRYEKYLPTIFEYVGCIQEPQPKISLIWIIGEFSEFIEDPLARLQYFIDTFLTEQHQVQKQILNSAVKIYIKNLGKSGFDDASRVVQNVFKLSEPVGDPDFHDQLCIYKRLLQQDLESVRKIILPPKPQNFQEQRQQLSIKLLDQLLYEISFLGSVYHMPPQSFLKSDCFVQTQIRPKNDVRITNVTASDNARPLESSCTLHRVFDSDFVRISAGFKKYSNHHSSVILDLQFENCSGRPLVGPFGFELLANCFGLELSQSINFSPIEPAQTISKSLQCSIGSSKNEPDSRVSITFNCPAGVYQFSIPVHAHTLFADDMLIDPTRFLEIWHSVTAENYLSLSKVYSKDVNTIREKLESFSIFPIALRTTTTQFHTVYYATATMLDDTVILYEIAFLQEGCQLCVKSTRSQLNKLFLTSLQLLLTP